MPRKEKIAAHAAREIAVLERSDLVMRGADGKATGLTANGLQLVELLAKAGNTQNFIASKIGLTQGTFRKMLGRGEDESPERLAWERGRAQHEQDIVRMLLDHGKQNVVGLIFYSKAKLGWKENEPPPAAANNILITLPGAMTSEQYYKLLGIEGPIDTRISRDVTPKPKALNSAGGDQPLYSNSNHGGQNDQ